MDLVKTEAEMHSIYAPFFGFAGVFFAIVFSAIGAAYGTAKSGVSIAGISTFRPDLIMRALIPVVMAGILAVYGLVTAVVIVGKMGPDADYPLFYGAIHLAAGLAVGMASLAAGYAIGIVGDSGVRGFARQPKMFVTMVLILIFSEVLGLYGLIVALILNTKAA
ncbi:V-type proton ATPase 16 kDa proteolipid subunit 2 [Ramicandelaber brevisporus]|nr:V-type proton ATPase 16 kDa proteolipid subunit 2 [Ramicandelaber brevisporus]